MDSIEGSYRRSILWSFGVGSVCDGLDDINSMRMRCISENRGGVSVFRVGVRVGARVGVRVGVRIGTQVAVRFGVPAGVRARVRAGVRVSALLGVRAGARVVYVSIGLGGSRIPFGDATACAAPTCTPSAPIRFDPARLSATGIAELPTTPCLRFRQSILAVLALDPRHL